MNETINTTNNPENRINNEALSPCDQDIKKETFRTNFEYSIFFTWLFFVLATGYYVVICIFLSKIFVIIIDIICVLFVSFLYGSSPFLATVTIDPSAGILKIREYSTLICFGKQVQFNLRDIRKIYIDYNEKVHTENYVTYSTFDLIVKLKYGEKKIAISGQIDKNDIKRKLLDFLYKFLPSIVDINSDQNSQILRLGQPMPYNPVQQIPFPGQQPIPYHVLLKML